jgi:hypothetical protein
MLLLILADTDAAKAARLRNAMLQIKKIYIVTLQRAYPNRFPGGIRNRYTTVLR